MTDKYGRKIIYIDYVNSIAIIEDPIYKDYTIVSRLSIKDDILDYQIVLKFVKTLSYAKLLVDNQSLLFGD